MTDKDETNNLENAAAPASQFERLVILKKCLLWIPYILTMISLWWLSFWLRDKFSLSQSDTFLICSAIIFYGAAITGSQDIRLRYWPK